MSDSDLASSQDDLNDRKEDSQSDDYSLASSYDAEVAYRHEPDPVKKQSKLNKFHQAAIAKKKQKKEARQRKVTACFNQMTALQSDVKKSVETTE